MAVEERDHVSMTPAKKAVLAREALAAEVDTVAWLTEEQVQSVGKLFFGVKRKEMGSICVDDVSGIFGDRAEQAAWQSVASDSVPSKRKRHDAHQQKQRSAASGGSACSCCTRAWSSRCITKTQERKTISFHHTSEEWRGGKRIGVLPEDVKKEAVRWVCRTVDGHIQQLQDGFHFCGFTQHRIHDKCLQQRVEKTHKYHTEHRGRSNKHHGEQCELGVTRKTQDTVISRFTMVPQ